MSIEINTGSEKYQIRMVMVLFKKKKGNSCELYGDNAI